MIHNNIIKLEKTSYYTIKNRITRVWTYYAVILTILVGINFYKLHKIYNLKDNSKVMETEILNVEQKLYQLIEANNAVDKTLYILNSMNMESNLSLQSYTSEIRNVVNNLSYYYQIYSPVVIDVTYNNYLSGSKLANISLVLNLQANSDENIIKFVDSVIKNVRGFIKVQELEIVKNSDSSTAKNGLNNNLISLNLKLDWYILAANKITKDIRMPSQKIIVELTKPMINLEDTYRMSVWSKSLMS